MIEDFDYFFRKGDALNPDPRLIDEFLNQIHHPVKSNPMIQKPISNDDQEMKIEKTITLSDFAKTKLEMENRLTSYPVSQSKAMVNFVCQISFHFCVG